MTAKHDPLSPHTSPNQINKTGVRRVNNLPLILIIGGFMVFVGIIAMVAVKRADKNAVSVTQTSTSKSSNTDTSAMAAQVVDGKNVSGIIASATPVSADKTATAIPIARIAGSDAPPLPPRLVNAAAAENTALDQIQTEKLQQFEDAVKAQTRIALPNSPGKTAASDESTPASQSQIAQSAAGDTTALYQAKLQQIRANLSGSGAGGSNGPQLLQKNAIQQFAGDGKADRWKLGSQIEAPATPYELRAGAVIPGTMISGIKSTLPGQIIGQVSQNVYDTATGKYLLIPQGTRLVGTYSNEVQYGQDVILVAWQRLTFPDGKALDIGAMPGADSEGYSGFHDQVNNHYIRIFGSALLMSGIVAGIAYSQDRNNNQGLYTQPTMSNELSQALGQQLGQVTAQMIAKNLNIAPLNKIRSGYPFNIMVIKDLVFSKPYQSFDY